VQRLVLAQALLTDRFFFRRSRIPRINRDRGGQRRRRRRRRGEEEEEFIRIQRIL